MLVENYWELRQCYYKIFTCAYYSMDYTIELLRIYHHCNCSANILSCVVKFFNSFRGLLSLMNLFQIFAIEYIKKVIPIHFTLIVLFLLLWSQSFLLNMYILFFILGFPGYHFLRNLIVCCFLFQEACINFHFIFINLGLYVHVNFRWFYYY